MKLHRVLVTAIINGLKEILLDHKQADLTVAQLLQSNTRWGSRDRNFIAQNIYHIIRYKRLYEYCINEEIWGESAIWRVLGAKLILENFPLADWPEFSELKSEEIIKRNEAAQTIRDIRESIPVWLDKLGVKELGAQWDNEIAALNTQAQFSIRVNTLRTDKDYVKKLFTEEGIEFSETDEQKKSSFY